MASKPASNHGMVIFAKDIKRVSTFYQQVLKLKITGNEKSHIVLTGSGLEIVIHAISAKVASGIKLSDPPELRSNTAIKPAFFVDDLEAIKVAVKATGGTLKALNDAWEIRGAKVLDGSDPEGNIVQFKQR